MTPQSFLFSVWHAALQRMLQEINLLSADLCLIQRSVITFIEAEERIWFVLWALVKNKNAVQCHVRHTALPPSHLDLFKAGVLIVTGVCGKSKKLLKVGML